MFLFFVFREADEIDSEVLELTKEVSNFAFPGVSRPSQETVLTGFKDIISDTFFNAVGTTTARKIAEKESISGALKYSLEILPLYFVMHIIFHHTTKSRLMSVRVFMSEDRGGQFIKIYKMEEI